MGCIPTKSLLEEAFHLAKLRELDEHFNPTQYSMSIYQKTQQTIDDLKDSLRKRLTNVGVHIYDQSAHFIHSNTIMLEDGQSLSAEMLVIATGAKPVIPPFFENIQNLHTSSSLLKKPYAQKQKFAVIGAGIIGCEMASLLQMLGHDVTLLETQSSILSTLPKDLAQSIHRDLKQNGIEIIPSVEFEALHQMDDGYYVRLNGQERNFDQILLATGRKANVDSLHLENTKVTLNQSRIEIDEQYRTSDDLIFALGDVMSKVQLAHVASYQAKDFYSKLFKGIYLGLKAIPNVLYTPLQAAWITDPHYIASDTDQIYKATLSSLAKQKIKLNTRGSIKLVLKQDNILVHAEILSVDAAELIGICALWMENKTNIKTLKNVMLPHPSLNEAFLLIFHQFD